MSIFWQCHKPACTPYCLAKSIQVSQTKSKFIKYIKNATIQRNLIFLIRTGPALAVVGHVLLAIAVGQLWSSCILPILGASRSASLLMAKTFSALVGWDRVRVKQIPPSSVLRVFKLILQVQCFLSNNMTACWYNYSAAIKQSHLPVQLSWGTQFTLAVFSSYFALFRAWCYSPGFPVPVVQNKTSERAY